MSFISLSFFVFFPVVTAGYFALPHRYRWSFLLLASCVFYVVFIPWYIFVLFALILVDYLAAIQIEQSTGRTRTLYLLISITSLVSALLYFKYFDFIASNLGSPVLLHILVPLGLSFHTFQSLAYVIEVYRGTQKAERNLGIYALYVMFYPQLVAGPIERPGQLLHQFREEHSFEYARIKPGLTRMAWGFFKKMIIADRLAVLVDRVYATPHAYSGLALLVATAFFTFEVYLDFSAYCDIALGAAQVMGFELMENFNRPFAATSMADFWRRWHISLSSWFRDYVFSPLAFTWRAAGGASIAFALLLTFLATGFWHGANWTYGIFGLLNGLFIIIGMASTRLRERTYTVLGLHRAPSLRRGMQVLTVFALFAFSCIFFRATTLMDAWYILTHLSVEGGDLLRLGLSRNALLLAGTLVAFVLGVEYWGRDIGIFRRLGEQSWYIRWMVYFGMIGMLIAFSESAASQFIYFQF